jgi:hypothetical protein
MAETLYPSLYQVNTRILVGELARARGRPATLDDWPDAELDRIAAFGFDYVWMLGVWQTGAVGRALAPTALDWGPVRAALPDLSDADLVSSPFAVTGYTANTDFGGEAALARLRERLRRRGLRLILDFVPNHTACDHPWVFAHPEYYVHGTEADLAREPRNYCRVDTAAGAAVLAHGRDPYFPGWTDTLQLNYRHPAARAAMVRELLRVAEHCDGVRCDMAMLLLPDVFARTWGDRALPAGDVPPADMSFWPEAVASVRERFPGLVFLAEVYWDREWDLQQEGFDYTYDKRLYDRLHEGHAGPVRAHLSADLGFLRRCAHFLENHDEPRAAATFTPAVHRAAAVVTYFIPGLRFFHEGQFEGRRLRPPMQLARRPAEPVDEGLREFYGVLLACLKRSEVRAGRWQLLACRPAWDRNPTGGNFIAYCWEGADGRLLLGCVNYGSTQGQCYADLPLPGLRGRQFVLRDLLGPASYDRSGDELAGRGLYLDMPAWGYHLFDVVPA